jgi:hypothetical protein
MRPTSTLKIFYCCVVLLLSGISLRAADNGLGVTLLSYTVDTVDSVNLGYNLTIYAEVTNYDSLPFNGFIDFGLHNNEQLLTNTSIFSKPPYSGDSVSLGGGTTVPAIFNVGINMPYFRPGPDVVVVWPISSTRPALDSIVIHLNILDPPNGINEQKEIPFTYTVVNNTILLKTADSKINFKQVRIYNNIGQQLSEMQGNFIASVPLPALPRGIYFCELVTADGRKTTIKFVQ